MSDSASIQTNGGGQQVAAPRIEDFIKYVHAGVSAWEQAGQILVRLLREDPQVFRKITEAYDFITRDTLEVFHSIGIRTLYPLTMLLPRRVSYAVRAMRYDAQKRVCTEPIQVVSRLVGDKPVVERKSVSKLTDREVKQALWPKGNRSVEWQVRLLSAPKDPAKAMAQKLFAAPAATARTPKHVQNYAVRRTTGGGNNFVFEKTMAHNSMVQRVLLTEGQALIELTEYQD